MTHGRLSLCVHRVGHRCIDNDGEWDGTWDYSYKWAIYEEEGCQIDGFGGFHTAEQAKIAGEKALKRWEEKK